MTKFLVVGDVHGDISFASAVCRAAESLDITNIFQVGDFGVWDHTDDGVYFLDKLNENSSRRGTHWYVTLGNHENYDSIERYQAVATRSDFIPLRDNITVLGNKTAVFEMDGVKFASVGGAYSIDKYARTEGVSWWRQEEIKFSDIALLEELVGITGPVDILFTHDSPTTLPEWEGFIKDDPYSHGHRKMLDRVGEIARPSFWFHGHYHRAAQYQFNDAHVVALGANPDAMPWTTPTRQHNSVAVVTVDESGISWDYNHEWAYA
jgi:Calcineurin-like phosphoesterase